VGVVFVDGFVMFLFIHHRDIFTGSQGDFSLFGSDAAAFQGDVFSCFKAHFSCRGNQGAFHCFIFCFETLVVGALSFPYGRIFCIKVFF